MLFFEHQDQYHWEAPKRKSTWVVACQTNIMFQNPRNLILKNHLSNSYSQNPSHIYYIHYYARKCKFFIKDSMFVRLVEKQIWILASRLYNIPTSTVMCTNSKLITIFLFKSSMHVLNPTCLQ